MSYAEPGRLASRRPFITTPYFEKAGVFVPEIPTSCLFGRGEEEPCLLRKSHLRERKTGPCFPLTVMRCEVHDRAFTLYPRGHVPYGRRAVAPVGPGGEPVADGKPETDEMHARAAGSAWQGTLFAAALDAAAGRSWAHRAKGGSDTWWSTQGRLLDLALAVLGLAPEQDLGLRSRIAEALAVDTLLLLEGVRGIEAQPVPRTRGQTVSRVLERIPRRTALRRLLVAGHLAGRWGEPLWWEREAGVLCRQAFWSSGTDPPGSWREVADRSRNRTGDRRLAAGEGSRAHRKPFP